MTYVAQFTLKYFLTVAHERGVCADFFFHFYDLNFIFDV
jgi:hypothetical protein